MVTPAAAVTDATSTTDIVTQFNQLLANMRTAGLLSSYTEENDPTGSQHERGAAHCAAPLGSEKEVL